MNVTISEEKKRFRRSIAEFPFDCWISICQFVDVGVFKILIFSVKGLFSYIKNHGICVNYVPFRIFRSLPQVQVLHVKKLKISLHFFDKKDNLPHRKKKRIAQLFPLLKSLTLYERDVVFSKDAVYEISDFDRVENIQFSGFVVTNSTFDERRNIKLSIVVYICPRIRRIFIDNTFCFPRCQYIFKGPFNLESLEVDLCDSIEFRDFDSFRSMKKLCLKSVKRIKFPNATVVMDIYDLFPLLQELHLDRYRDSLYFKIRDCENLQKLVIKRNVQVDLNMMKMKSLKHLVISERFFYSRVSAADHPLWNEVVEMMDNGDFEPGRRVEILPHNHPELEFLRIIGRIYALRKIEHFHNLKCIILDSPIYGLKDLPKLETLDIITEKNMTMEGLPSLKYLRIKEDYNKRGEMCEFLGHSNQHIFSPLQEIEVSGIFKSIEVSGDVDHSNNKKEKRKRKLSDVILLSSDVFSNLKKMFIHSDSRDLTPFRITIRDLPKLEVVCITSKCEPLDFDFITPTIRFSNLPSLRYLDVTCFGEIGEFSGIGESSLKILKLRDCRFTLSVLSKLSFPSLHTMVVFPRIIEDLSSYREFKRKLHQLAPNLNYFHTDVVYIQDIFSGGGESGCYLRHLRVLRVVWEEERDEGLTISNLQNVEEICFENLEDENCSSDVNKIVISDMMSLQIVKFEKIRDEDTEFQKWIVSFQNCPLLKNIDIIGEKSSQVWSGGSTNEASSSSSEPKAPDFVFGENCSNPKISFRTQNEGSTFVEKEKSHFEKLYRE